MLKRAKGGGDEQEPGEQPILRSNFVQELQSLMNEPEKARVALLDLDGEVCGRQLTLLERAKLYLRCCSSLHHRERAEEAKQLKIKDNLLNLIKHKKLSNFTINDQVLPPKTELVKMSRE